MERDELAGHFGGIGAYMTRNDAEDLVVIVIPDRPVAKAGVQDGDVLLEVDGKPITKDMPVDEIVALVGATSARRLCSDFGVNRSEPLVVSVVCVIETPSVEWRVLDKDEHIGYVRISLFGSTNQPGAGAGLAGTGEPGVDKLVLDLRGKWRRPG